MLGTCTLTGLDERTDMARVGSLSARYPFAEWGILYGPKAHWEGASRYPGKALLEEALGRLGRDRVALHVCGTAVFDLLAKRGGVEALAARFGRVQVNMTASRHDPEDLRRLVERLPEVRFITQRNAGNEVLLPALAGLPNHAVLFDASGGAGLRPARWPDAPAGTECGYAGGLGPRGLGEDLRGIEAASGGRASWVDMETGVRDVDDWLDLDLCEAALSGFASHLADFTSPPNAELTGTR